MTTASTTSHSPRSSGRARLVSVLKVALPLGCMALSVLALKAVTSRAIVRPEQISAIVAQAGVWGPLLFVIALAIRPLLLLPGQVFAAVAGMLWGGLAGTALSVAGSWLSLVVVVAVGRRLLRKPLARWIGGRRAELEQVARRHDFLYALVVMLNPLLPADVCIAVAAGAGARLSRLGIGAALGTVPGTLSTAYFGSAITRQQPALLAMSLVAMAVSLVGGAFIGHRIWRALKRAPAPAPVMVVTGSGPSGPRLALARGGADPALAPSAADPS